MVVVAFVLLLACTNLANLLLARATERRKEIAVRLASRREPSQARGQLMTESMLLAIGSGACGLLLAYWLSISRSRYKPPVDVPLFIDLHIDYRVLAFTCLISLVTGVLFGLLPALQATKVDLLPALKDETSTGDSRRSWLKIESDSFAGRVVARAARGRRSDVARVATRASAQPWIQPAERRRGHLSTCACRATTERAGCEFQKRLLERVRAACRVWRLPELLTCAPVDLHFSRAQWSSKGSRPNASECAASHDQPHQSGLFSGDEHTSCAGARFHGAGRRESAACGHRQRNFRAPLLARTRPDRKTLSVREARNDR